MDIKTIGNKSKEIITKFKYPLILLLIGLSILLIPDNKVEQSHSNVPKQENIKYQIRTEQLSEILQTVEGAGRVHVLLSVAAGEKTIYQTNHNSSDAGTDVKIETVIVSDSQRNEAGLVNQINPPVYLGAIVVCEGADSPAVKLAITQAVSKITGLGADSICVLKMK